MSGFIVAQPIADTKSTRIHSSTACRAVAGAGALRSVILQHRIDKTGKKKKKKPHQTEVFILDESGCHLLSEIAWQKVPPSRAANSCPLLTALGHILTTSFQVLLGLWKHNPFCSVHHRNSWPHGYFSKRYSSNKLKEMHMCCFSLNK